MSAEDGVEDSGREERDKEIAKKSMEKAAALVRISNGLPRRGGDYEFCNSFSVFLQFMEQQEERIRNIMSSTLKVGGYPMRIPKDLSIDAFMDIMISACDSLAERSGLLMDELEKAGRDEEVKVPKVIVGAESTKREENRKILSTDFSTSIADRLRAAHEERETLKVKNSVSHIVKPQKHYGLEDCIDNSHELFHSKLVVKHNKREQKKSGLVITDVDGDSAKWAVDDTNNEHPYRIELEHFKAPDGQMISAQCIEFKSLEDTPYLYVDSLENLEKLVADLNEQKEFSVDLEHHSTRSFMGLTCLIQISTRATDYVIDPFPIWKDMNILNDPFSNPNILKVLHGSDKDIQWLQRDFGIYVVNMFDTYNAMHRLDYEKFSLAHLVQTLCNVSLDKQYQMSDWRVRPLTDAQLNYARSDTHYLLYCYDILREELLAKGNELKNLLVAVYTDGRITCSQVYTKPEFNPLGYERLLSNRRRFNTQQVFALAELWKWRDLLARQEDESLNYVLPDHMMLNIAEVLPREVQGIFACCSPTPPLVKTYALDIHRIIYSARDKPLEKCFAEVKAARGEEESIMQHLIDQQNRMTSQKALLRCKLDFSHTAYDEEIGLKRDYEEGESLNLKKDVHTFLNVLSNTENQLNAVVIDTKIDENQQKSVLKKLESWASPFECYAIAMKDAAKREADLAKQKQENPEPPKKKMFSHHDPVVSRLPVVKPTELNQDNIKLANDSGESEYPEKQNAPSKYTDDQILTKKALKRQRKIVREGADMRTDLNVAACSATPHVSSDDQPSYVKKLKSENDTVAETKIEPVDYSQFDQSMFNQSKKADSFDPFNQNFRHERNKKSKQRRGRGGFNRMGTMSTGYKPDKKN